MGMPLISLDILCTFCMKGTLNLGPEVVTLLGRPKVVSTAISFSDRV